RQIRGSRPDRGTGAENHRLGLAALRSGQLLRRGDRFPRDARDLSVPQLHDHPDLARHHSTLASFCSFSTSVAATFLASPSSICAPEPLCGKDTATISRREPAAPTCPASRPRSAGVCTAISFFFAAMIPLSEA